MDSLNEHTTGRRCSLPSEHAVDDGEKEDEVNNTFPVWHHHCVGGAQVRLTLMMKSNCESQTSETWTIYGFRQVRSWSGYHLYIKTHEARDEAVLFQSVGQTHHAGEGELCKNWTPRKQIKSPRRPPADVCLWWFTVIQRVHFCLVLHYEEEDKKNEAQDDHSHPQDGQRSVEKCREVTRGNSQFIWKVLGFIYNTGNTIVFLSWKCAIYWMNLHLNLKQILFSL